MKLRARPRFHLELGGGRLGQRLNRAAHAAPNKRQ